MQISIEVPKNVHLLVNELCEYQNARLNNKKNDMCICENERAVVCGYLTKSAMHKS